MITSKIRKILVSDNDLAIRQALFSTLSAHGFRVVVTSKGEEALEAVATRKFDSLLLDVSMPLMDGIEASRRIRSLDGGLPVIMLSVLDNAEQVVRALEAGTDDYVTKPFDFRELIARLRSAVRRRKLLNSPDEVITCNELELDVARRTPTKRGQPIHLTPKEFDLLN